MPNALPQEGFRDLYRRVRMAGLWAVRVHVRRALFRAETELGLLGWEQADFFDEEIGAEVKKVQEFENTQASLLNTSAELASRKAKLDKELAREKTIHDEAQTALAAEREPLAAKLGQAEAGRRLKLEASARFARAVEELGRVEKQLEARSLAFMNTERPTIAIRAEAREVSDELSRIPGERSILLADKVNAIQEAERLELVIASLQVELKRIDAAASAARDRLATASRRLTAEMRGLERERKKSSIHMSRLDRQKRKPYRSIGACLADHGIAPLNQPQMLEKVAALRERDAGLTRNLAGLKAACSAANTGVLIAFYLLLVALLFSVFAIASHFLRR